MNQDNLTSVRVGCHTIPLVWAETKDYGEYSTDLPAPKITLNKNLGPKGAAMTLVHELIHAIADQYGFNESEEEVKLLETAVCRFLMENQEVVKEILEGLSCNEPRPC